MRVEFTLDLASDEVGVGNEGLELAYDLVGTIGVDVLIVVSGEEGTSVLGPEFLLDLLDGGGDAGVLNANAGNDVEPGDDGPEAVLLTDVVATGSKTLLTADGKLLGIEKSAEELPSGGDLVDVETLGLADEIDGSRSGHGAGETVDAVLLEVGDQVCVVGNDGEGVTRRDKGVGTVNHVTVTITIRGSTEGNVVLVDNFDEGVSIGEVRIRVATVKVGGGFAVLNGTGEAKLLLEDGLAVGASDTVKTVEEDLEVWVGDEELLDKLKVEDVLEHGDIIGSAVDNLNFKGAIGLSANGVDVDVGDIGQLVRSQGLGGFVDLVRYGLGGGATVGEVVLDAEVVGWACGEELSVRTLMALSESW